MRKTFKTIAIATDNANYSDSMDVDTALNLFNAHEIYEHMPLIDNRPAWCQITEWWNIECDKHLLLGIFIHGYCRFGTVMNNNFFCFYEHLKNTLGPAATHLDGQSAEMDVSSDNINEQSATSPLGNPSLSESTRIGTDCTDEDCDEGMHDEDDDGEENIELEIENPTECSARMSTDDLEKSSSVPDHKLMNKLLSWLVSFGVMGDRMLKRANMKKLKKKEEIMTTSRLNDLIKMSESEILMNLNELLDIETLEKAKSTVNLHALKVPSKDINLCSQMSNDDINLLAISFIQYGAPIETFPNTLSWDKFREKYGITSPVEILKDFFTSKWMPFCIQMCCMYKLNSGSSLKHSIPNPFIPVGDHYTIARGFCMLFFQRQKIMHAINFVLESKIETLVQYLRGSIGFSLSNSNMPIWWCPWKHDIDLLVGCARHGYLNMNSMIKDKSLSFSFDKIKPVLANMITIFPSNFFADVIERENWIIAMSSMFPDSYQLEQRIILILQEVTASLDDHNPYKIIQGYSMPTLDDLYKGASALQCAVPFPQLDPDSVEKRKLYIQSVI